MAVINDEIKGFSQGADLTVERSIGGLPDATTVTKAWLTIKKSPVQDDASAVLQLIITPTASASGQVIDDGATSGTAVLQFVFTRVQTALMTKEYGFGIQVMLSDGTIDEPIKGTILGLPRYTQATN